LGKGSVIMLGDRVYWLPKPEEGELLDIQIFKDEAGQPIPPSAFQTMLDDSGQHDQDGEDDDGYPSPAPALL
jgi:hypothetical protein